MKEAPAHAMGLARELNPALDRPSFMSGWNAHHQACVTMISQRQRIAEEEIRSESCVGALREAREQIEETL